MERLQRYAGISNPALKNAPSAATGVMPEAVAVGVG